MPNNFTITFPYYRQPEMLKYQLEIWKQYPPNIEVVLVDDGSPYGDRAEEVINKYSKPTNIKFSLYRILVDLPWNDKGARNLGHKYANNEWVLSTDIDHIVTNKAIDQICRLHLDPNKLYHFPQRKLRFTNKPHHPHAESMLVNNNLYWRLGGWDEYYSGVYCGLPTVNFKKAESLPLNDVCLELVCKEDISDAKCPLDRNKGMNENSLKKNLINQWKKEHNINKTLNFRLPWVKVI